MNLRSFGLSLAALVSIFSLANCGKDEPGGRAIEEFEKAAFKTTGVGTWSSGCRDAGAMTAVFSLPKVVEQWAYGDSLRRSMSFSYDCGEPLLTVTEDGRYETASKVADRTFELNQTFDSVKINPRNQAGADLLNAKRICGRNNWTVGVTQDITADSSAFNNCWVKTPRDIYDISKVEGRERRFGAETGSLDKTTAAKRPKEIDSKTVFHRE